MVKKITSYFGSLSLTVNIILFLFNIAAYPIMKDGIERQVNSIYFKVSAIVRQNIPVRQSKPKVQPIVPVQQYSSPLLVKNNPILELPRYVEFNRYTDLGFKTNISVEDMNEILEYWYKYNGTPFRNHGEAFIKASKESGLHPLYILAHAAWESQWGKSYLARTKHNYFGINATDYRPYENAYEMGESMEQGIIVGAMWIANNYYKQDQTSLHSMIYGKKRYASAKDKWIAGISSIIRESFEVI